MSLLELKGKTSSKKRKRVGRGNGSGKGTYSTRGMKGQTARAGGKRKAGFEGGQSSFLRKMPKLKGFKNFNHFEYQPVNVGQLNIFKDNSTVDPKTLYEKNLIAKKDKPVKLLGGKGDLEKILKVLVHKASKSAEKIIIAKKGSLELIK